MKNTLVVFIGLLLLVTYSCTKKITKQAESPKAEAKVYFTDVDTSQFPMNCKNKVFPLHFRLLEVNYKDVRKLLVDTTITSGELKSDTIIFSIPMPDGKWEDYRIKETRVLSKELAMKFPTIKTYSGNSIPNPTDHIRLDISPQGLRAMITTSHGTILLDPYCSDDSTHIISYNKSDLPPNSKQPFEK